MAHGGGQSAVGKKPDAFSKAVVRVAKSYAKGLSRVGHDHYPSDTYFERAQIRHGKAKPVAYRKNG